MEYLPFFFSKNWVGCTERGNTLSFLFAVFVDIVLIKLKRSSLSCRMKNVLINAIMYAEDLLLLSISLHDLQLMVDLCFKEFEEIGLSINLTKSTCLKIGPDHNIPDANITINETTLEWVSELKYLGVTFLKASTVKCNWQTARHQYFRSLNGIFGKIGASSSINVTLSLINSFCIPLLVYGSECFSLNKSTSISLNLLITLLSLKMLILLIKNIIKQCQFYCGCLPLSYVIDKRKIVFLYKMADASSLILSMMFNNFDKSELDKLLFKYKLNFNSACPVKSLTWSNFVVSCTES